jgi:hypothetical protein
VDGSQVLTIVAAVGAGVLVVSAAMRGIWWAIGKRKLRAAGARPLTAGVHRLWSEPGPVEHLDPVTGPGGPDAVPLPPFRFIEEHHGGSQPCVSVRDHRGRVWRVKWGPEVRSEAFAVRFAWACGYFVEETHFVADGTIEGSPTLTRARACVDETSGRFCEARFELDDPSVKKLFEEHSWAWDDNPFVGGRELSGLKIVVMLLSNWDSKDRRDVARGSNTAIFEHRLARGRREARYLISDWGGSMGRWGRNIATRARWDIEGFEAQTPDFVTAVEDGHVTFGYSGQRADVNQPIPLEHVRWFCPYLERLDLEFLTRALDASGATGEEADRFARALRERIEQLAVCSGSRDLPVQKKGLR